MSEQAYLDIATIERLEDLMMDTLPTKRYRHCFAVAEIASDLAFHWDLDEHAAFDAGLLHDMLHYLPDEELLRRAAEYHVPIGAGERAMPLLLHGPLAAAVLERDWGLHNQQILNAIRWHTVADPQMDDLAKLVYLSDLIEPGRPDYPGLAKLKALCLMDLDAAMVQALENTTAYLAGRGQQPHPDTQRILAAFRAKVAAKQERRQKHMSELTQQTPEQILEQCRALAEDKKGRDLAVIPMSGRSLICDYFLIVTAGSTRQAQSISDAIELGLKEQGQPPLRIEGYREARWILLDLGAVVVHIFQEEEREYYSLERLWGGATPDHPEK